MIFVLLMSCILADNTQIPEAGFGTPTYLLDLGFVGHIAVPCIFAGLILLSCYPSPGLVDYQMSLISIVGVCLGLYHTVLDSLPGIQTFVLIPAAVCIGVMSLRKETRVLALSIANMYLGGYLALMLLGVKYKVVGIPVMIIYGLFIYFIISAIQAVFVNVIRSTSCTFFFLCFLTSITMDTMNVFDSMLSYSFSEFNVMRALAIAITVSAFAFFFCLPIFIDALLVKRVSSAGDKLEVVPEKDVQKVEVV